jgi:hypothetical protein
MTDVTYAHHDFAGDVENHVAQGGYANVTDVNSMQEPCSTDEEDVPETDDNTSDEDVESVEYSYDEAQDEEDTEADEARERDHHVTESDAGDDCSNIEEELGVEEVLEHDHYITDQRSISPSNPATISAHNISQNESYTGCTPYIAPPSHLNREQTTTYTSPRIKPPSRIRSFAGKAKEHLRDQDARRKAVRIFQNGAQQVKVVMVEVEAKSMGSGLRGMATKSNGKKLAKVAVKVAMKRLL